MLSTKSESSPIVVINGQVIAEGTSSVVELRDPTAHAEVMALRNAGTALGRHLFEDGVMYASSDRPGSSTSGTASTGRGRRERHRLAALVA
jgi:pyrimidine deaminase RibD-like protein